MNEPLVSVIIPAYNHEAYIQDTIRSIAEQDYPSIEIIVVDDGSSDGTLVAAREACANCGRPSQVITQTNQGAPAANQRGFETSRGTYVWFIASDDQLLPGAIAGHVEAMAAGADAVFGRHIESWEDGRQEEYTYTPDQGDGWDPDLFIRGVLNSRGPLFGSAMMRRNLIERIGGLDHGTGLDDWPIMVMVARNATRVAVTKRPVILYRNHWGNTTHARAKDVLDWKLDTIRRYADGVVARRARAVAHRIFAQQMLMAGRPWRSLTHRLMMQWYIRSAAGAKTYWTDWRAALAKREVPRR